MPQPLKAASSCKLSREVLVETAVSLADREGLEALTIRRLAREIGVTPMALYWHVKDKDELMLALGERMFAEVELPPSADGSWESELRGVMTAVLRALSAHPQLAPLALPTILTSEAGLTAAERVLTLLARAGFEAAAVADLAASLLSSIVTLITAQPGTGAHRDPEARRFELEAKRAHVLSQDAARFPRVVAMADHLFDCDDQERYFRRGIDLLVLGLSGLASGRRNAA